MVIIQGLPIHVSYQIWAHMKGLNFLTLDTKIRIVAEVYFSLNSRGKSS